MSNIYMGSIKRNRILGGNQEFTSVCVKFETFASNIQLKM